MLRLPGSSTPRRALAEPTTSKLAERILRLDSISDDDEKSVLHVIDAIEAKNKLKRIAASVG